MFTKRKAKNVLCVIYFCHMYYCETLWGKFLNIQRVKIKLFFLVKCLEIKFNFFKQKQKRKRKTNDIKTHYADCENKTFLPCKIQRNLV